MKICVCVCLALCAVVYEQREPNTMTIFSAVWAVFVQPKTGCVFLSCAHQHQQHTDIIIWMCMHARASHFRNLIYILGRCFWHFIHRTLSFWHNTHTRALSYRFAVCEFKHDQDNNKSIVHFCVRACDGLLCFYYIRISQGKSDRTNVCIILKICMRANCRTPFSI